MNFAALAWWLAWNSETISPWQGAQAFGETTVTIVAPSCLKAAGFFGSALWHSQHPTPCAWCFDSFHCATRPGVFCS